VFRLVRRVRENGERSGKGGWKEPNRKGHAYFTFSTDYANARWKDQPMKQEKPGIYKAAIELGDNRSITYLVEVVDIAQELTGYTSTPPLRFPSEPAKGRSTKNGGGNSGRARGSVRRPATTTRRPRTPSGRGTTNLNASGSGSYEQCALEMTYEYSCRFIVFCVESCGYSGFITTAAVRSELWSQDR